MPAGPNPGPGAAGAAGPGAEGPAEGGGGVPSGAVSGVKAGAAAGGGAGSADGAGAAGGRGVCAAGAGEGGGGVGGAAGSGGATPVVGGAAGSGGVAPVVGAVVGGGGVAPGGGPAGRAGARWAGPSESSNSAAFRPSSAISPAGSHGSVSCATSSVRATTSSGEGRSAGFFARQAPTSSVRPSGSPVRSGSSWAIRYITACMPLSEEPNGCRRVPANASTEPSEKTSPAGVSTSPRTCSGDM